MNPENEQMTLKDMVKAALSEYKDIIFEKDNIWGIVHESVYGRNTSEIMECNKMWDKLCALDKLWSSTYVRYLYGMQIRMTKNQIGDRICVRRHFEGNIYSNLEEMRKQHGLTQEQLAMCSDVSIQTIQKYEQDRGMIGSAQYGNLNALAKALGCKVEELIGTSKLELDDLYDNKNMKEPIRIIKENICKCNTIVISGNMASGKTSLARSLSSKDIQIASDETGRDTILVNTNQCASIQKYTCMRIFLVVDKDKNHWIKRIEIKRDGEDEFVYDDIPK